MLRKLLSILFLLPALAAVAVPPTGNDTLALRAEAPNPVAVTFPQMFEFYKKHNIHLTAEDDIALYNMVQRWHRTPYRWGGTSRCGVDCQGFALVVNDSLFCRTLPRGAGSQYHVSTPVKKHELQTGDLVFFKIAQSSISHVGVYLKDGKFAHASCCCGVIISDLSEPYYRRWFYAGGRLAEAQQQ